MTTRTQLEALSEEFLDAHGAGNPFWASILGIPGQESAVPDLSEAGERAAAARLLSLADRAEAIAPETLDADDRVTRLVLIQAARATAVPLQDREVEFAVSGYASPIALLFAVVAMSTADGPTAEASYRSRVTQVPGFVNQAGRRALAGVESGLVATRRGVEQAVERVESYLRTPLDGDLFVRPAQGTAIEDEVRALTRDEIRPALAEYVKVLTGPVLDAARSDDQCGVVHLPDGRARYARAVAAHTTTDRTPEQIHELGLELCARLREEQRALGRKVFGTDDAEAITDRLRNDPALRYETADQLLDDAKALIARAEAALGAFFGRTYSTPCIVEPMDEVVAPTGVLGEYMSPSVAEGRPGLYNVNTYQPHTRTRYEYEALAFHEAVPGHHLQFALAQERDELPAFRRYLYITAFGEGWGLYAERLADEMGLYSDDLFRFGMISFDAWRASRLVVDTGMHHYGWTRQQAIDFMLANSALTLENITNEVDRYIAWPGQATAYMTGRLEIDSLKQQARERLGARFDIRGFHDAVLANGSVPLTVLRREVERWIDQQVAGSGA